MIILVLIDTSILVLLMSFSFLKDMVLKQLAEILVPMLKTKRVSYQKVWVKAIFTGGAPYILTTHQDSRQQNTNIIRKVVTDQVQCSEDI